MTHRIFSEEEKKGLVDFCNSKLNRTINSSTNEIFELVKPGVLFCELVEAIEPGTITGKVEKEPKHVWEINHNHELMLEGAKKIGCNVVNIGAADLSSGTKHLVLGIFWQVVRVCFICSF